jgi:methionyl-tRNA formyltransferase
LSIAPEDTRESLTARLAQLGADLLREMLPLWFAGDLEPQSQNETLATYAPQIKKEEGHINWNESADAVDRRVRAFFPWPGAFTHWRGKSLKILHASVTDSWQSEGKDDLLPGTVVADAEGPAVIAGQGVLQLQEVQLAGKRPVAADAFARGARGFVGARLV